MANDVMTMPANIQNEKEIRPDCAGPVFSVLPDGNLHMRFTVRTRSIEWKQDPATRMAMKTLSELQGADSRYIYYATLQ